MRIAVLLALAVPACAGIDAPETGATENGVAGTADIVINEFLAGSGGRIELYNAGSAPIDLGGWHVDDVMNAGTAPKAISGTLAPGAFLVVPYNGINTASADRVRVVDREGFEHDAHDNGYAGHSISGQCFGRSWDGGDWAGVVDCTLGASNGAPPPPLPPPPADGIALMSLPRRDKVLLQGTIVLPTGAYQGEVLVEGDTITCVGYSCYAPDAAVVATRGLILPGMIDAHDHVLFDIFDETDWAPQKAYANHNQWTNEPRYKALVDAKQYLNGETSVVDLGCELDKYGELKHLVAGTTSVQGSANPTDKTCFGSLARTIDQKANGLSFDRMQTSTLFPSPTAAASACANFEIGKTNAYVVHIGEGVDASARAELSRLPACLDSAHTAIVHGTAFGDPEMTTLAQYGMSLVWSPRSNKFLYNETTDIPLALSKGINVAVAPDWSIGGSQNMLDELRFADQVDNTEWGDQISPQMLFQMATINAAKALGVSDVLGSIEVGKKADLMVIPGDVWNPYGEILAATPADVRLVMVGGVALYGDPAVAPLGPPNPGCETLDILGRAKFACVAQAGGTASNKLGQTFAQIQQNLSDGLAAYDALDLTPFDFFPLTPLVR